MGILVTQKTLQGLLGRHESVSVEYFYQSEGNHENNVVGNEPWWLAHVIDWYGIEKEIGQRWWNAASKGLPDDGSPWFLLLEDLGREGVELRFSGLPCLVTESSLDTDLIEKYL